MSWIGKALGEPNEVKVSDSVSGAVADPDPNAISDGPILPPGLKGRDLLTALTNASVSTAFDVLRSRYISERSQDKKKIYNWQKESILGVPSKGS